MAHILLFDFLLVDYFTVSPGNLIRLSTDISTDKSYSLINLYTPVFFFISNIVSAPVYNFLAGTDFFLFNFTRDLYMLNNFHLFLFNVTDYFYLYIKDSFFFFINFFFLTLLFFSRLHRSTSV